MLLSDILYKFMPQNVKDDIKKDSLQWKIIVVSFVALNVFIFLQLTRMIFVGLFGGIINNTYNVNYLFRKIYLIIL